MTAFYHVWFSTKARKPVLEGEVADDVRRLLLNAAKGAEIELLELESAFDHVHILVAVKEGQDLSSIMHRLKGASSRFLSLKHPELTYDMGTDSLWQKSYGSRRITESEVPTVRRYIKTQNERPHRHDV
jgi:putative transposase